MEEFLMMKKNVKKSLQITLSCLLLLALCTLPGIAFPGATGTPDTPWPENYVPGQLLVGMVAPVSPVSANLFSGLNIESLQDLTDVSSFLPLTASGTYTGRQILLLELTTESEADMRTAIGILEGYSSVAYAEPNFIGSACAAAATPDTPDLENLWGLERIQADLAWEISTGSHDVLVGVMDSGIDYDHSGLIGNVDEVLGYNFLQDNPYWWYDTPDPLDDFGHGTHVAGIIGEVGGNDEGVIGLNWDVTIVPLKIWDGGGYGSEAEFIAALAYAECLEIPVINLSGGWSEIDGFLAMQDAVEAYSGLIVAAAGNEENDNDDPQYACYPAAFACGNVISVAASNQDDALADFSGYGATAVDLAAPGSDILSTVDYWLWDMDLGWYTEPGYEAFSGTSVAVPHVAGTAALLKACEPGLSAADIKAAILGSVDYCQELNGLISSNGRLNAYAALCSLTEAIPYTLYFDSEYGYIIDAYEGINVPVYICAYVEDEQGSLVTAPELASLEYTSDSGVTNTSGIFSKEDLEILPGEQTYVTARATFSNGKFLEERTLVDAPYIDIRK
jgi:subtilisin family serine protease